MTLFQEKLRESTDTNQVTKEENSEDSASKGQVPHSESTSQNDSSEEGFWAPDFDNDSKPAFDSKSEGNGDPTEGTVSSEGAKEWNDSPRKGRKRKKLLGTSAAIKRQKVKLKCSLGFIYSTAQASTGLLR